MSWNNALVKSASAPRLGLKRPALLLRCLQVTNTKRQLPTGEAASSGSVAISQVMTEPELVQRSEAFEQAIQGGDREALNAFCRAREQQVGTPPPAAGSAALPNERGLRCLAEGRLPGRAVQRASAHRSVPLACVPLVAHAAAVPRRAACWLGRMPRTLCMQHAGPKASCAWRNGAF